VEGAVQQPEAFLDEDIDRVLRLAGLVEPAGGRLLFFEGGEGADRRRPGQDQRLRLAFSLGSTRPAPPPAAGEGGADPLEDEDALLTRPGIPGQVAAVGQRQGAGEIELGESE
jgi:hypothetical protein